MRARFTIGVVALVAAALAIGALSADHGTSAPTSAPTGSTPVPGAYVDALAARPDGSLSLSLSTSPSSPALGRLDPGGRFVAPVPLPAPTAGTDGLQLRALTPGGGLAAATWNRSGLRGQLTLSELGPGGTAVAPTLIPTWGTTGDPSTFVVGPTGAMAVMGPSAEYGGSDPRVVFRPAGTPTFGSALHIDPTLTARRRKDRYTLDQTRSYAIALGPDGGGAVFVSPGFVPASRPYLRRISPDGVLGAAIPIALPDRIASDLTARIAFGPAGTLVVAISTEESYDEGGDGAEVTDVHDDALWLTSLPPGASKTTRVRRLAHGHEDGEDGDESFRGDLDLAVGPGDRVLLTAQRDHSGPGIYEGTPTHAVRTAVLPDAVDDNYYGVPGPDGSATVLAMGHTARGNARVVWAAHHARGEPFGPAQVISPTTSFILPARPIALPDGDVVAAIQLGGGHHVADSIRRLAF